MKAKKEKGVEKVVSEADKKKRSKINRIIASIMVGLVVWGALVFAANSIINESKHVEVCRAKINIPDGTKISQDNINDYIEKVSISESLLPEGYVSDPSNIVDSFVSRDYMTREVITLNDVNTEESMTEHIENPIEISVAVTSIDAAVGGILREGDYINIYSVATTLNESEVNEIAKNAYVTKALDSNGTELLRSDTQSNATVINLIIPMEAELRFNKELLAGTVRMSLIYNPDVENIDSGLDDNTDDIEDNLENNLDNLEDVYNIGGSTEEAVYPEMEDSTELERVLNETTEE